MKWLIGFFASFFTNFLTFFVKKFGYSAVLFVALRTVQVLVIVLLLAFMTYFISFYLQIWNNIVNVIDSFQNISVGSGDAYGVSLSTILTNTKAFIFASGLSDAFVTAGNLFMSVLSLIFIKALYKLYVFVYLKIYGLFKDGINLLSGSNGISL